MPPIYIETTQKWLSLYDKFVFEKEIHHALRILKSLFKKFAWFLLKTCYGISFFVESEITPCTLFIYRRCLKELRGKGTRGPWFLNRVDLMVLIPNCHEIDQRILIAVHFHKKVLICLKVYSNFEFFFLDLFYWNWKRFRKRISN